jgi:hypothetical protein
MFDFFIRPRCCTEQAASKYKRSEWPAASRSAVPGEAVVAWQEIQATMGMEMHDDREDWKTQQKKHVCFSEDFGMCLVDRGDRRAAGSMGRKIRGRGDHSAGFMRRIY